MKDKKYWGSVLKLNACFVNLDLMKFNCKVSKAESQITKFLLTFFKKILLCILVYDEDKHNSKFLKKKEYVRVASIPLIWEYIRNAFMKKLSEISS